MSHSWLARQRKQTLLDLSLEAGLPQNSDTLKDDIVEALDAHLKANAARLSGNASFNGYFGGRSSSTPFKPRPSAGDSSAPAGDDAVKSAVKARGRKSTKVKQEQEEAAASPSSPIQAVQAITSAVVPSIVSATRTIAPSFVTASPSANATTTSSSVVKAARTPAPAHRRASELPGPPSPSVVADVVEEHATRLYAGAQDLYTGSGITEQIAWLRELCSSVTAVQTTFLLLEAFALQRALLPFRYVGDLPGLAALGLGPTAVHLPDLFVLLTAGYWAPSLLWAATSALVPALFGYFFNLTLRETGRRSGGYTTRHRTDPLTFNVVKALATWLVYSQGVSFGVVSPSVAERVDGAIYGGHNAVLIGAGVGILASLYDAALSPPRL